MMASAITGELLIDGQAIAGTEGAYRGIDPATGSELEPLFGGTSAEQLERACAEAASAFDVYRAAPLSRRALLLDFIAHHIESIGDALIARASSETGLLHARLQGELARTIAQLRLFAEVVREGSFLDVRIDCALPARVPVPRPDLRLQNVPLGPVAVFGASNFPLAFSVAGGDTASALAAGCPVIVKAHPAHPGTSELVGRAVQAALVECQLPAGVFALLHGVGNWLGGALVADPRIKAVGFTGSRGGGLALMRIANERPEPIPVYAEMSSINPVLLLPAALAARGQSIAKGFVSSLTLGAGQFCTNPGLVVAQDGDLLDEFIGTTSSALQACPSATMLTPGIFGAYQKGVERLSAHPDVTTIARGQVGQGSNLGQAALFGTHSQAFHADHSLKEEIFGASSLLVRCDSVDAMRELLEQMEGQLTITLQMDEADLPTARALMPTLERKAGRLLVNSFPTGVEVAYAMVHGGPFPSTSDGRSTSVGTLAIRRFLRPVCYQDFPEALLPEALRDKNSLEVPRRINGRLVVPQG
jgi:NADP-dependent aldehyde dehydrogenase